MKKNTCLMTAAAGAAQNFDYSSSDPGGRINGAFPSLNPKPNHRDHARASLPFAVRAVIGLATMFLALNYPAVSAASSSQPGEKPQPSDAASQMQQELKFLPGYILVAPNYSTNTYLVDRQGRTINVWRTDYTPALSTYLLTNGHLLRSGALPQGQQPMPGLIPGAGGRVQDSLGMARWSGTIITLPPNACRTTTSSNSPMATC